jgi:hypothetical protein
MDVLECINVGNSMFEEIFGRSIHQFKLRMGLQIQSQFGPEILRWCILRIVGTSKALSEEDMRTIAAATKLVSAKEEHGMR